MRQENSARLSRAHVSAIVQVPRPDLGHQEIRIRYTYSVLLVHYNDLLIIKPLYENLAVQVVFQNANSNNLFIRLEYQYAVQCSMFNVSAEESEQQLLDKALAECQSVLNRINLRVKEHENQLRLRQIFERFDERARMCLILVDWVDMQRLQELGAPLYDYSTVKYTRVQYSSTVLYIREYVST